MNQQQIGIFIAQMRKEKEMTQKQLAEKIGVSDKLESISMSCYPESACPM